MNYNLIVSEYNVDLKQSINIPTTFMVENKNLPEESPQIFDAEDGHNNFENALNCFNLHVRMNKPKSILEV